MFATGPAESESTVAGGGIDEGSPDCGRALVGGSPQAVGERRGIEPDERELGGDTCHTVHECRRILGVGELTGGCPKGVDRRLYCLPICLELLGRGGNVGVCLSRDGHDRCGELSRGIRHRVDLLLDLRTDLVGQVLPRAEIDLQARP